MKNHGVSRPVGVLRALAVRSGSRLDDALVDQHIRAVLLETSASTEGNLRTTKTKKILQGRKKSHFEMSFSCAEKNVQIIWSSGGGRGEGEGRGGAKVRVAMLYRA